MFFQRRWREFMLLLINTLFKGTRCYGIKRALLNSCCYISVNAGTKVVGPLFIGNCSHITIGKDCWIGRDLKVYGDGLVQIGDRCDLAPEVAFLTGSHEIGEHERRAGKGTLHSIRVGNGCWLCARTTLVGSVSIGDGSIVGAGSIVNKCFETDRLITGVPAKSIREL